MDTTHELLEATITELRAAGYPLVPIKVGYLAGLWSQGCYKPGELRTTSGAILNVSPLADGLVSIEFENGILSVGRDSTVKVFD